VLIKALAEIGPTTKPEALDLLAVADEGLAVADKEQVEYSILRLQANERCAPDDGGEPVLPPPIDPPEETP
jgi:hypothetical protein